MKIDTSKWGEFKVEELFDILKVTNKLKNSDLVDNGSVLVYSSTTENNGIFGKTNKPAEFTISNQIPFYLIFGDHTRSMSIVKNDFSVMDNVKILKPHIFNEYIIQFIITIWKKSIPNLGYARHWTVAKNIQILLPITSDGEPDYKYMEEYMKKIENTVSSSLTKIQSVQNKKKEKIDVSDWKEFKVGDFFDIHLSKDDIQPKNIIEGSTPLISSGKTNNGIMAYIEDKTAKRWNGNVLTVDMFGKVFYQQTDFYCVSHGRINILIPKQDLSQYILQFIGTSLEKITKKYQFNEMCTSKKLLKDKLYLPITSNGEPDYKYMEEYMKKIEEKTQEKLSKLNL